jgi:hypothetical protein
MEKMLDAVSRRMGEATSRRQAMKIFGAGLFGSAVLARPAFAAPQTCVTCSCGTGNPCNVKSTTCTVVRAFESEVTACQGACAKKSQQFCGQAQAFHCPGGKGCP